MPRHNWRALAGFLAVSSAARAQMPLTWEQVRERFQTNAISPEKVAGAIVRGIKRNQYLVHTSLDIQLGSWFQRRRLLSHAWPTSRNAWPQQRT